MLPTRRNVHSYLHKNKCQVFLLWADHNAEAIDELDSVNAANDVSGWTPSLGLVSSNADGLMGRLIHDDDNTEQ
jgi:hypothetical protein